VIAAEVRAAALERPEPRRWPLRGRLRSSLAACLGQDGQQPLVGQLLDQPLQLVPFGTHGSQRTQGPTGAGIARRDIREPSAAGGDWSTARARRPGSNRRATHSSCVVLTVEAGGGLHASRAREPEPRRSSKIERGTIRGTKRRSTDVVVEDGDHRDVHRCAFCASWMR
jgi:hypothetical protein